MTLLTFTEQSRVPVTGSIPVDFFGRTSEERVCYSLSRIGAYAILIRKPHQHSFIFIYYFYNTKITFVEHNFSSI